MLGLKSTTNKDWVKIAEENLEKLLTDHAYAEQKAAGAAVSLIINYSEETAMVQQLSAHAIEEMEHFKMVHERLLKRGVTLGKDRKDLYVNDLLKFFPKGGSRTTQLVHRLLYAALIEARSCERFRLLSEHIKDKELAKFYKDLMASEANHYTLFLNFARKFGNREEVDKKWNELLEYEAKLMKNLGNKETIHG